MSLDSVERHLAKKFEGRLFVDIHLFKINGDEYSIQKDYYTVKDGKVYMIVGHRLDPTGDTMMSVNIDCKMIGKYDPTKQYTRKIREYSYKEFKKLHKL